jgi:25S rRNA (uracil2634-N3)-methyltransferase
MLRADGEIHVNHKTTAPFCHWNIEELARRNSLVLIERVEFKIEDYPGYNNKRGDSNRCDEPFPLGECSTFKFRFSHAAKMSKATSHLGFAGKRCPQLHDNPIKMYHQPSLFNHMHPQPTVFNYKHRQPTLFKHTHPQPILFEHKCPQPTSFNRMHPQPALFNQVYSQTSLATNMNGFPGYLQSTSTISIEKADDFNGYHNHTLEPHGRTVNHVDCSYNDYKIYMPEAPGRTLEGDLYVSPELQHLSNMRSALWRRLVLTHGQHPEASTVV